MRGRDESGGRRDWKIVFVLGAARSGTTYLTDILDDYFDFGMSPEGHFVPEFSRRLRRYGDLSDRRNMDRLLADVRNASTLRIIREEWPAHSRFDVTVEELRERIEGADFAAVVYAVFACIADKLGKANVGTKNPEYTTCLPMLESMFPGQARYINVVRDGRDVALSIMQQRWGQKNAYSCAKVWNSYINLAATFERSVGPRTFMNIRYEDLVSDPDDAVARIERFLGISIDPARRSTFLERARQSRLSQNFGKWQESMAARDVARFEAVAGRNLEKWGYELVYASPTVGLVESSYLNASEFFRKVRLTLPRLIRSLDPGTSLGSLRSTSRRR